MFRRPSEPTSPRSSTSLPPSPTPSSPTSRRSARTLYQHPSGSRFLEDAVSAVFTSELASEVGTSASAGPAESSSVELEFAPATFPGRIRPPSSRLQKARRTPLPLSAGQSLPATRSGGKLDSGSEGSSSTWTMPSVPTPADSPVELPPRATSFCPATHSAETFTEYDRLHVRSGEMPALVLLDAVAPEISDRCDELLHTSLPSNRDAIRDMIPRRNGFVDTVLEAYNNHRGLIVRPDDLWLAIVTQFSFFVHGHAYMFSRVFATHDIATLLVEGAGDRYALDTPNMVHRLTTMMDAHIADRALCEWAMPSFTTTTPVDRLACTVALLGAPTHDDAPRASMPHCGIPRVTLEGDKHDWEAILSRLEHLKRYGFRTIAWYHLLRPVLARIVAACEHPDDARNLAFWNKIAHQTSADDGGGGGTLTLSGWITAFCVFDARGHWQGNTLNEERIREHEPKKLLRRADPLQLTPAQFAAVYTVRERAPYLALDGFPYPTIERTRVPCGYVCLDAVLDDRGRVVDSLVIAGSVCSQICSTEKTELFRNGRRDTVRPVSAWWYLTKRIARQDERGTEERLSVLSLLKTPTIIGGWSDA